MASIAFTVHGQPQPQGSKTVGRSGQLREANTRTLPWRAAVSAKAAEAMDNDALLAGPLKLEVLFVFPRPANHYGTGRNHRRLKSSAPDYCATRPDLDKLLRAIGDALTGIAFRDDAQLVIVQAEKHYGKPCAHIIVSELTPDPNEAT